MKANLCLHAGGALASREQVFAVPPPVATDTYHPLSHRSFVERVEKVLGAEQIAVRETQFALAKDGNRFFGLMQLEMPTLPELDYGYILAIRNSLDRSMSVGMAIGSSVFACDNLALSGDIAVIRRHTPHLLRDLTWMISESIGKLTLAFDAQNARYGAYKAFALDDPMAHDTIIRLFDAGVINLTDIRRLLEQWRKPKHVEFESRNAWSLFNGVTEVLKNADSKGNYRPNIWELPDTTRRLHEVMDGVCNVRVERPALLTVGETGEA